MKKQNDQIKVQVTLSQAAYKLLQKTVEQANSGFTDGCVNMSHCVEFAIQTAKFKIDELQLKSTHTSKLLQSICKEGKYDQATLRNALLKVRSELRSKRPKATPSKGDRHDES